MLFCSLAYFGCQDASLKKNYKIEQSLRLLFISHYDCSHRIVMTVTNWKRRKNIFGEAIAGGDLSNTTEQWKNR